MGKLKISTEEYAALTTKDAGTLYILTDGIHELYLGSIKITENVPTYEPTIKLPVG